MSHSRRQFLQSSAAFAVGFSGLQQFVAAEGFETASYSPAESSLRAAGLGSLVSDPNGMLDLPEGFAYRVISRVGETMDDGLYVPGMPDGMASFEGPDGLTILIRNHEITPNQASPFGPQAQLLDQIDRRDVYDHGREGKPCIGGTTTLLFDTKKQEVVKQFLSLTGTVRNCAGGPTPWGTWITCEEASDRPGSNLYKGVDTFCQQYHGYPFEVPASAEMKLAKPIPLKAMGRFRHEAVAVEPNSGIVFQTEDIDDGLIYRFIPTHPGRLSEGGVLQALVLDEHPSADTRNWSDEFSLSVGEKHTVRWIDMEDVESPNDDLRLRGFAAGAARFARGEGMWYSDGSIYFACTTGGAAKVGQLWKYTPSESEGQWGERDDPGTLELFVEPNDSNLVANADNLTASPWGDLVVCEDRYGEDEVRLVGVTPVGKLYTLGHYHARTELAGANFSPDGSTLFVNLQHEGLTLAITGPWPQATLANS